MKHKQELEEAIQSAVSEWACEYSVYELDITVEIEMTDGWVEIPRIIES